MSNVRSWRQSRVAKAIGIGAVGAVSLAVLPPVTASAAAVVNTITINSPSTGKVAADTEKQVILMTLSGLTGATLSEENVKSVDLGACTGVKVEYIVTSTSTIAVKTGTEGCAASEAAQKVKITFANDEFVEKATTLQFVAAPEIAELNPVITDNSSNLDDDTEVKRFVAAGNQTIRVRAAETFAFAVGLTGSFGGKALSSIAVYKKDGTPVTSGAGDVGNYFIAKTGAAMSTDAALSLTQGGVTKTFTGMEGVQIVNAPTVTALTVTSGKTGNATQTVISGTGFNATAASYGGPEDTEWDVLFCGVSVGETGVTAATASSLTVKTPTAVGADQLGEDMAGPCPVQVVNAAGDASVPTATTNFTFLTE